MQHHIDYDRLMQYLAEEIQNLTQDPPQQNIK